MPRHLSTALAFAAILAAGALAAPLAARTPALAAPAPAAAMVKIDNFTFGPAVLTVRPGTVVTWINHDDIPHGVMADDRSFKSKVLDTNESFSFSFTKPGDYPYFCFIHPHMTGKVVVKAG